MSFAYDVLVAGGGMAGCAAALSAVRQGARVLLVEQHDCLGGNATRAMVQPWQSFHAATQQPDGSLPRQVIGGIAQEFVADLLKLGGSLGHIVDPIGFAGSLTPIDSDVLQNYLPGKLAAAGVTVSLNVPLTVELLRDAPQIVDATGTAAAARLLGASVVSPSEPQPLSWLFTMSGVDTQAVVDYQGANPAEFVLHPAFAKLDPDFVAVSGFFTMVAEARNSGQLTIPRDRLLFFSTPRASEVAINTTRIPADHPDPLTEGRRQIAELAAWLPKHIPGFASATLGRVASAVGERESYRILGKATLSTAEIINGEKHADAVARGCYPVDIHSATTSELTSRNVGGPGWYDIPLGCLESVDCPNLLAAGRCISADRQGFASARVLPTAISTGEAAGLIAAQRALRKILNVSACVSRNSLV